MHAWRYKRNHTEAFLFLWRHFHLREEIDNEPGFEDDENEDDDKELMEIELTCVKRKNNDTEEDLHEDNVETDKKILGFKRYSH